MYQKIRTVLFYISIAVFFISVPLTLIFSLGFDMSWKNLKLSRAGLINVNTKPGGAFIYLNNKDTGQTTPAVLRELKPGVYDLKLQLKDYYPWQNSVEVQDGKVTDLKEITLFKRIPYLDKVNIEEVSDFALDKSHNNLFFISKENNVVYKIDVKGKSSQPVYKLPSFSEKIKKWLISNDEKKIIYCMGNRIYVGYFSLPESKTNLPKDFMVTIPEEIVDIFWHGDSEHFILVTTKDIKIFELFSQGKNNTVTLTTLNFKRPKVFYDTENNALYFTDLQETSEGKYNNLYRIQLGRRQVFPFKEELEKK